MCLKDEMKNEEIREIFKGDLYKRGNESGITEILRGRYKGDLYQRGNENGTTGIFWIFFGDMRKGEQL